jgi:hypothetical protein
MNKLAATMINSIAETVTDGPICSVSRTLQHDANESDDAPSSTKISRITAELSNRGGFKFIPSNSLNLMVHVLKTCTKQFLLKGEFVREVHDLNLTLGGRTSFKHPVKPSRFAILFLSHVMKILKVHLSNQPIPIHHPRHLRDYSYIRGSLLSVCIVFVLYVIVCLVESLHCVCLVWENS